MTQTRTHTTSRLYVENTLSLGLTLSLPKEAAHYLLQVMRKKEGNQVRLFNGREGEWLSTIVTAGKKELIVQLAEQLRPQQAEPDIWLVVAPLKNEAMHYVIEKAVELGVAAFLPAFTERTVVHRVNNAKLEANIREAAEQCERLTMPLFHPPGKLETILSHWPEGRILLACDEMGSGNPIQQALNAVKGQGCGNAYGVLIGPEGGFTEHERTMFGHYPFIIPVGLGPRILRADTAAIAALSCLQSVLGDWDMPPRFSFD